MFDWYEDIIPGNWVGLGWVQEVLVVLVLVVPVLLVVRLVLVVVFKRVLVSSSIAV